MEQQRIYILCMLFVLLVYSYIFGQHNYTTNLFISIAAIVCLYKLFTVFQVYTKMNKKENYDDIQLSTLKDKLLIAQSIKWLEYDTFLSNVIVDLYPITRYDIEVLKIVMIHLNKFLKIYYHAMSSTEDSALLYKNIRKNQTTIQSLEDKKVDIIDELKNLVYVLPTSMFYVDQNIPEISFLIEDYLNKKIALLSTKLKMKQTKFASASL